MIHLITGLPGNSKTLFALRFLIDWAARENRPVYYAGLKDFKHQDERLKGTRWLELDPLKWHEVVPSGSIVFVDEAQKVFRNRSISSNPPLYVTELEEHRHKGIDFVFCTQHPSLIDPAVRRLTQSHRHLIRIFGMEVSTCHFWDGIKDKPEAAGAKKESQKTKWVFDKSLYGLYKSADVHTMKRQIPLRAKLLLLAPLVVLALGYVGYRAIRGISSSGKAGVATAVPVAGGGQPAHGLFPDAAANRGLEVDQVADAREYLRRETPRVVGLPSTAPKYDELTKPDRVPVPAMCIQRGGVEGGQVSCKCFTQQATPLNVPFNMCIDFARNGYFQDFDPNGRGGAVEAKTTQMATSDQSVPARAVPEPSGASRVAYMPVVEAPVYRPRVAGLGAK